MKIRTNKHFQAEVATASLNDIMFFLLLFFLIVSTVTNPNVIKVLLPKSDSFQAVNKKPVTLTVTENKQYYLNNKPVSNDMLEESLIQACAGIESPTMIVQMPYNLTVQDLVSVMEIGIRNKIKVVLATDKK